MTQEESLLLKDLCGRIPYGVKVIVPCLGDKIYTLKAVRIEDGCIVACEMGDNGEISMPIECVKPYLFPLSSMSTSEMNEITDILGCDFPWFISEGKLTWTVGGSVESELFELTIDQLERLMHIFNSRHYDYRGLIGKHLTNDATGLGIYKEETK